MQGNYFESHDTYGYAGWCNDLEVEGTSSQEITYVGTYPTRPLCSDLDFEEMVADIYYEGHAVGMLTQEEGIAHMKIKLYQLTIPSVEIPLDDYVNAILEAKQRLLERND